MSPCRYAARAGLIKSWSGAGWKRNDLALFLQQGFDSLFVAVGAGHFQPADAQRRCRRPFGLSSTKTLRTSLNSVLSNWRPSPTRRSGSRRAASCSEGAQSTAAPRGVYGAGSCSSFSLTMKAQFSGSVIHWSHLTAMSSVSRFLVTSMMAVSGPLMAVTSRLNPCRHRLSMAGVIAGFGVVAVDDEWR